MENLKNVVRILITCIVLSIAFSSPVVARSRGDISEAKNAVRSGNAQKAVQITLEARQRIINQNWPGLTTADVLTLISTNVNTKSTAVHYRLAELTWYIALYTDYAKSKNLQPSYFKNKTALQYFEESVTFQPNNNKWVKARDREAARFATME